MHDALAKRRLLLALAFAVFALAVPWLYAGEYEDDAKNSPRGKTTPLTVAELAEKLKAGIFKLAEADLVTLLGRPSGLKRPGDAGSDLQMRWEYATAISAIFKDGKLSEVTGSFSEHLPVERITVDNFKRLRVGMTEGQVVELLGKSHSMHNDGATVTRAWGRTGALWVSINEKGLAFNPGTEELNVVFLPAGFQLPVPAPAKR
jgi:hypothetical protein